MERKDVGSKTPATHNILQNQIWIQVFKWDAALLKEPQFGAVQS